jgi:hypothetical protein
MGGPKCSQRIERLQGACLKGLELPFTHSTGKQTKK